jgi:CDP-glycerol glycerophosphotransferase (TagB/SpsB family)
MNKRPLILSIKVQFKNFVYGIKVYAWSSYCVIKALLSRRQLIIVGCHTRIFHGNAYHYARYLANDQDRFNVIAVAWHESYRALRRSGIPFVPHNSLFLILLSRRAHCFCYTCISDHDGGVRVKCRYNILLWHGMPIKGVGLLTKNNPHVPEKMDYCIATSRTTRDFMSLSFGLPPSRVIVTGEPKTDAYISEANIENVRKAYSAYSKIIYYAPTYREDFHQGPLRCVEARSLIDEIISSPMMNEICEEYNACILLGMHPLMRHLALGRLKAPFFDAAEHGFLSEYIMGAADLVISDYSGIVYDALLRPVPLVLFCPDYEDYHSIRGFPYFSYLDEFGDIIAQSDADVAKLINRYWENDEQLKETLKHLSAKYHEYPVGTASDRLTRFLAGINSDSR